MVRWASAPAHPLCSFSPFPVTYQHIRCESRHPWGLDIGTAILEKIIDEKLAM